PQYDGTPTTLKSPKLANYSHPPPASSKRAGRRWSDTRVPGYTDAGDPEQPATRTVHRMTSEELDRNSFVPLYRQLADILRRQIETGVRQPGELLPSEPRLGQRYDIGTLTVRHAIGV